MHTLPIINHEYFYTFIHFLLLLPTLFFICLSACLIVYCIVPLTALSKCSGLNSSPWVLIPKLNCYNANK